MSTNTGFDFTDLQFTPVATVGGPGGGTITALTFALTSDSANSLNSGFNAPPQAPPNPFTGVVVAGGQLLTSSNATYGGGILNPSNMQHPTG